MIVTIDGPAGAGKSSTARRLAERLGFAFLDTGAMYRAAAWAAQRSGIDLEDAERVVEIVRQLDLDLRDGRVWANGVDVTELIRTPEVTARIHYVSDQPAARSVLVELQRRIVAGRDFVSEGRDQGTVAFPDAECKVFLTATPEERARRRARELQQSGKEVDWQEVLAQQEERDRRDAARPVGRLAKAADAIEVSTDGQTEDEVVAALETLVRSRMP